MILMASILGIVTLRIMYVVYDKHNICIITHVQMYSMYFSNLQYRASRAKSDP